MNIAEINANLLVALDALLTEGTVTGAARRLGVSQPAMSHSLARLRELFGDPLLVRSGARLVPTPLADQLVLPLRVAIDGLGQVLTACERFEPRSSTRTFRIAASDGFQLLALGPLMQRVHAEAPHVNLVMHPDSAGRLDALERGRVDVVVEGGVQADGKFPSRKLAHQRYVCIARREHPRIRARLGVRAYCEVPHALVAHDEQDGLVDRILAEQGRSRRVAVRVPDFAGLGHLVASTDLIATIPEAIADCFRETLAIAIHRPPVKVRSFDLHLYWHRRHDPEPGHRWLREHIAKVASRW